MIEDLSQDGQLLRGNGGVASVDGLVDAGDDDGGVAGELAGRVDGVSIPWTAGKAGGREQRCFRLAEGEIQLGEIAIRSGLEGMNAVGGSGEMRCGCFGGCEVERGEAVIGGSALGRL